MLNLLHALSVPARWHIRSEFLAWSNFACSGWQRVVSGKVPWRFSGHCIPRVLLKKCVACLGELQVVGKRLPRYEAAGAAKASRWLLLPPAVWPRLNNLWRTCTVLRECALGVLRTRQPGHCTTDETALRNLGLNEQVLTSDTQALRIPARARSPRGVLLGPLLVLAEDSRQSQKTHRLRIGSHKHEP